jgi:hypothetical protein
MHRGYVKLWRVSVDKPIFQNAGLWQFATWCLMKATHKKITQLVGFQEVELEPGQFVFGRDAAASQLSSTPQKIRTCVKSLVNIGFLTIKSTNKYSIITIVNWDTYQPDEIISTSKPTSSQPTNNQQITTNKNNKNNKNIKEKKTKRKETYDFRSFDLPDWVDRDLFIEFCKNRHADPKGKIRSERAISGLVNKLSQLIDAGNNQTDIITEAITNNWKSFYPPKNHTNGIANLKPQTYAQAQDLERRMQARAVLEYDDARKKANNNRRTDKTQPGPERKAIG